MRRLTYALQFVRPAAAKGEKAQPAVARSVRITTAITDDGVKADIEPLGKKYQTAVMENTATVSPDGKSFFESGTITFGDPAKNNRLHFGSIYMGSVDVYDCPEKPYTAGTVMWQINKGEGFSGQRR